MQIEIGLGDSQGRRTLYGIVAGGIVTALFILGHFVTPVVAQAPQVLTPERWQAAELARKAAAELGRIDIDMALLAELLKEGKPEPVSAMLLAQRIYARHREGTSATAPVRLALIAAAEAAAQYASGAGDRESALAALTRAASHLASFQPYAAAAPPSRGSDLAGNICAMMQLPFHWTRDSLEAEERRLRLAAEARAQALATLLEELAMRLAPELVEARRRQDPACFLHMDGAGWRQFWHAVEVKVAPPPPAAQPSLLPDTAELQAALQAMEVENERLRGELDRLQTVDAAEPPGPAETVEMAHLPAIDFTLPQQPPAALAGWFANWPRDGMALSVLAQTGWSLRHAIAQAMAARLGITATAGSLKRLFGHLHRNGLWQMETVAVGQMSVSLVQLTEKGREAAAHLGITAVTSEWERLHSEHGGSPQLEHTALVCMFTHQARQRHQATEVCPATAGPSAPDVLLRQGSDQIYVEVEAESGDPERRMRKWRNLADLQGFVALCALTPESARRLILEARGASLHGRATDIDTLFRQPGLWAIEW